MTINDRKKLPHIHTLSGSREYSKNNRKPSSQTTGSKINTKYEVFSESSKDSGQQFLHSKRARSSGRHRSGNLHKEKVNM